MRMKKQYCSPEERYRHKLNMLEPGSRMLAAAGILLGVGAALYWAGWLRAAWVAFGLAADRQQTNFGGGLGEREAIARRPQRKARNPGEAPGFRRFWPHRIA